MKEHNTHPFSSKDGSESSPPTGLRGSQDPEQASSSTKRVEHHAAQEEESDLLDFLTCGSCGVRGWVLTIVVFVVVAIVLVVVLLPRTDEWCFWTETPQLQELHDLLAAESTDGGAALETRGTPQYLAFDWLARNVNLTFYSNDKKKQRYALATLYYATHGDESWKHKEHWLDDFEECGRWFQKYNVDPFNCTSTGAVTRLDLYGNNLRGSIPPEIGMLSGSLAHVDLCCNDLVGRLPLEVAELTRLTHLGLSANSFTGTLPIESLPMENGTLVQLDLGLNSLSGPIPSEIGLLTSLRALLLYVNVLSGTIPDEIRQLTNLSRLWLEENELTGTIPYDAFHSMSSLHELRLNGNKLTGTFVCPEFIPECYISCPCCNPSDECRVL